MNTLASIIIHLPLHALVLGSLVIGCVCLVFGLFLGACIGNGVDESEHDDAGDDSEKRPLAS